MVSPSQLPGASSHDRNALILPRGSLPVHSDLPNTHPSTALSLSLSLCFTNDTKDPLARNALLFICLEFLVKHGFDLKVSRAIF
jgi:hypothetical protein